MSLDLATLGAILAMAGATVMTRLAGLVVLKLAALTPRARRMLDAIPPAVMVAVVTPTALATGPAESLACAVTAVAALRLPMLAAATAGVVTVALLRLAGL
ncbi:MAG: AzlD family protein [Allorhizobium sp.]